MKYLLVGVFSVGLLLPAVGQSVDFDKAVKEIKKEANKVEQKLSDTQKQAIDSLKNNRQQSINPCALNERLCKENR